MTNKLKISNTKLKNGFTLLELLVVISIMGILVALGAVAYNTAQKKGRDARRRGDMKAIQSAFEQYYGDNMAYNATCASMAVDPYMPGGFPSDPKPSPHPDYSDMSTCTTSTYCICAELENETGNASVTDCSAWVAGDYYCVVSQQ